LQSCSIMVIITITILIFYKKVKKYMCICFFIFLIILKYQRFVVYTLYMRFIIFCNLHILAETSRMSPWTRIYMQNIRFSTNIRDKAFFLTLVANLGLPLSIWLGNFEVATRNETFQNGHVSPLVANML